MYSNKKSFYFFIKYTMVISILLLIFSCSIENKEKVVSIDVAPFSLLDLDLSTPEKKSMIATKIMGSIGEEEIHTFMRIHIYGYSGKNLIPFFSMNNYVVQKWNPQKYGYYDLQHYEVGYFTKFDTDEPIKQWENPVTGEMVELENFILGPITRVYTPDGVISPGLAPQPLRINVIGDRIYIPRQTIESFPNIFKPEEWPKLSSGPTLFWDSMYTYSASIEDVLNPNISSVLTEIHMQNLVSWSPFLEMGQKQGRTMARGFGTNISGFDDLDPKVRADFEKYTPEIFHTDTWSQVRFDSIDYYQKKLKERQQKVDQ